MESNHLFVSLAKYVLPAEVVDYFELLSVDEIDSTLHLRLDELNVVPREYADLNLSANGFHPESTIKDFPLRDRQVILHIRRRRWVDSAGKSYSRNWDLTAEGTRYSKEFAAFLKEAFGYLPNSGPIP